MQEKTSFMEVAFQKHEVLVEDKWVGKAEGQAPKADMTLGTDQRGAMVFQPP